ncbi:uncharacterized protein PG986_005842 [Apiospora aurea]|uniref:Protein BCP1 n=1 Tax=Apiospora aurea TaxID=335848 RepID=A0ABR1QIX7_9PEZI
MAKKRAREADGTTADPDKMVQDGESSDDEDFDIVNVDFEWFNFNADIDFHGSKALLRQLLDVDSALFDISGLADLILSQPTIGSTHREKKPMANLISYLSDKAKATSSLSSVVPALLAAPDKHVGLVLSERLINMPSEIAPPMYSMLIDEIEAAVEDKEPYEFSHYLVLSKTYQEVESTLDVEERKKKKGKQEPATFYFHPEDEVLHKYAAAHGTYAFTNNDNSAADSKRAFQEMGVMPSGHMILIEASKFADAVKAVGDYINPPS